MRLVAALLCLSALAGFGQSPQLVFDHKIGSAWDAEAHGWMSFVAISSDGRRVAANGNVPLGKPRGLGLWTFPAGEFLQSYEGAPLAISPDFRFVATSTGVMDLRSGHPILRLSGQWNILSSAAFPSDAELVALADAHRIGNKGYKEIAVLRTADGSVISTFGIRHADGLAFDPAGRTLASGHWNNIMLWDVRTGARLALLMAGPRPVSADGYVRDGRYFCGLAFSRDGKLLAAGSDDGELQIWDVAGRRLLHSVKIGYGYTSNPAFGADAKIVAAGAYADGTVSLVDVASGSILQKMKISMFGCGSVAFTPDGRYLIAPSNGGQLGPRKFDSGGTIRVFRLVDRIEH